MDIDDHGAPAGKTRRRLVVEARDLASIERRPLHEPRLRQRRCRQSTQLALSPPRDFERPGINGKHVDGRRSGRHRNTEVTPVPVPLEAGDHGTCRQGSDRSNLPRRRVEQVQLRQPGFVGVKSECLSIRREVELLDIPVDAGVDWCDGLGYQVQERQLKELGPPVARDVGAATVHRELGVAVRDLFVGGHRLLRGSGCIHQPQPRLRGREELHHQQGGVFRRPVKW